MYVRAWYPRVLHAADGTGWCVHIGGAGNVWFRMNQNAQVRNIDTVKGRCLSHGGCRSSAVKPPALSPGSGSHTHQHIIHMLCSCGGSNWLERTREDNRRRPRVTGTHRTRIEGIHGDSVPFLPILQVGDGEIKGGLTGAQMAEGRCLRLCRRKS